METPLSDSSSSPSTVDSSRPFPSVKQAVAIFGERVLLKQFHSSSPSKPPPKSENGTSNNPSDSSAYKPPAPSPPTPTCSSTISTISSNFPVKETASEIRTSPETQTPNNDKNNNNNYGKIVHGNDLVMMLMVLKRLESELQETKMEVKLLKERESETEVALASLNAELHRNMSKIAKVEAAQASKSAAKSVTLVDEIQSGIKDNEERKKCEAMVKNSNVDSPTLAQILRITDYDSYFGDTNYIKKSMKKKPIIPLLTDLFVWRKKSPLFPQPLFRF
ncbi:uncharacterized protein LOC130797344 [Amaranthus tricolor]|uniref:uncharacterized protein LOC130797344 n=1 Tax=Amaranthus tricolor TaxID=29722 RepID=UPI0025843D08|nr:uncharacterized protein LOC130797344 [Amaranthus tricolor]